MNNNNISNNIIDIEYIKYIQNKYKVDCFYIDARNNFFIIDTCKNCNKLFLNDLGYQFDFSYNTKEEYNAELKVLEDNNIEFISYYDNVNRDSSFFCDCNNL